MLLVKIAIDMIDIEKNCPACSRSEAATKHTRFIAYEVRLSSYPGPYDVATSPILEAFLTTLMY